MNSYSEISLIAHNHDKVHNSPIKDNKLFSHRIRLKMAI